MVGGAERPIVGDPKTIGCLIGNHPPVIKVDLWPRIPSSIPGDHALGLPGFSSCRISGTFSFLGSRSVMSWMLDYLWCSVETIGGDMGAFRISDFGVFGYKPTRTEGEVKVQLNAKPH